MSRCDHRDYRGCLGKRAFLGRGRRGDAPKPPSGQRTSACESGGLWLSPIPSSGEGPFGPVGVLGPRPLKLDFWRPEFALTGGLWLLSRLLRRMGCSSAPWFWPMSRCDHRDCRGCFVRD
eukprot:1150988-Alexandrium_andersonii.AAC.1